MGAIGWLGQDVLFIKWDGINGTACNLHGWQLLRQLINWVEKDNNESRILDGTLCSLVLIMYNDVTCKVMSGTVVSVHYLMADQTGLPDTVHDW